MGGAPREVGDPGRGRRRAGVLPRPVVRPAGAADRGDRLGRRRGHRRAGRRPAGVRRPGPRGLAAGCRRHPVAARGGRCRERAADRCRRGLVARASRRRCWVGRAVDVLPGPLAEDPAPQAAAGRRRIRQARGQPAGTRSHLAAGDRLGGLRRADARRCSTPSRGSRAVRYRDGRSGRSPGSSARESRRDGRSPTWPTAGSEVRRRGGGARRTRRAAPRRAPARRRAPGRPAAR